MVSRCHAGQLAEQLAAHLNVDDDDNDNMATSLAVPVAYISVLITALAIFSRVYRRRKLGMLSSQAYVHNSFHTIPLTASLSLGGLYMIVTNTPPSTSYSTIGLPC
jgi:hypothetical protein